MTGTTPTLTIGDAGAEDTKIVFDGNAQDWHVGLDDSADDFTIGLGSTLGTTSHVVIDETGAMTRPLQPCFCAKVGSAVTDFSNDQHETVPYSSELFDLNSDFNNGTYTFTAPVTGKYHFDLSVEHANLDNATAYCQITLQMSNNDFYQTFRPSLHISADAQIDFNFSVVTDMDASDTAYVTTFMSGTAHDLTDIGASYSYFSGFLVA